MRYEIDDSQILEFARRVYEAGETGYSDLRDAACASLLAEFLADKKRIVPLTNLSMNSVLATTDVANFNGEVYSIADRAPLE